MTQTSKLRVRKSVLELQEEYHKGHKKPLEDVMRAWKGIKELPSDDPRSFFMLGGFHGEPFRGKGETDSAYWGGYCMHGNVLFPTWHRVYLYKLEEALQSIPGCADVMLPYWDETDHYSLKYGIPSCLTDEKFMLDGKLIDNPLRSFIMPVAIIDLIDNGSPDQPSYSKPKGYETVRFPLSGLVGTPADVAATEAYNKQFDKASQLKYLNSNVVTWLNDAGTDPKRPLVTVNDLYKMCLTAPNYTVFSNTTSFAKYNYDNPTNTTQPLEQPHNDVHISVGGPNRTVTAPVTDANGDMGENDTAGLDPIFYFHHCNVDRVFWIWQKQNGFKDHLEIIADYPGTKSSDAQGPTPGYSMNAVLSLASPLYPFAKDGELLYPYKQHDAAKVYTSNDCINIETQLNFTYSIGSLEKPEGTLKGADIMEEAATAGKDGNSRRQLFVTDINRGDINGSFIIAAYIVLNGVKTILGYHSVLSRKNVKGCANCLTHLDVAASFSLSNYTEEELKNATFAIEIRGKEAANKHVFESFKSAGLNAEKPPYHLEVR
ncbi:tyrosinase family protein [Mucilaginibacter sp. FT3.2]|uniref:tyrosinase family protein n=1 Tax=Mucilaginibacter sp. FT3.2 TaxID=2723090 RepID=UPI0016070FFA|nr:tyrosinase family protein [Mucilaginibacter sp. FT3.2]MBB6233770.1 tyrosinase [Mucilaginibacter sp. FT3.2]